MPTPIYLGPAPPPPPPPPPVPPVPPYVGASGVYMVRVVDIYGIQYAELENAVVTSVTWERNGFGGAVFSVPTTDPKILTLRHKMTQREIQIWRDPGNGKPPILIFWGPVVRYRANSTNVEFQAMGLLWYFSRLTFGPPLIENIVNGRFDAGLTGWTVVGAAGSLSTNIRYQGATSLRLLSGAEKADNYASQTFTFTGGTPGNTVFVSAAFQIVTFDGTAFIGPAYKERGLYVRRIRGGVTVQEVWTPITNAALPRNVWHRIYAPTMYTDTGVTETWEVRLYSPGGDIRWDVVSARFDESQGSVTNPASTYQDIGKILNTAVTYAQTGTQNKPYLNIAPPGTIGTLIHIVFPLSAFGNIWTDAMLQFVTEGLCDVGVSWNASGATRQFVCYAKQGSFKPQLALVMGGNVADFEVDEDGQATAGAVIVLGNNSKEPTLGVVHPQSVLFGYAVDTAANGGVTLDAVVNASYETTLDGMQNKADTELARLKDPVKSLTVTTKENLAGSLIGVLGVGDTIPVVIDYGFVQENANYRVAAMTLNPATETMSVTVNLDLPGANALSPTQRAIDTKNFAVTSNVVRALPTPVASFRDLAGTDLSHIYHGQSVVYDQPSGTLVPQVSNVVSTMAVGSQSTAVVYPATTTFGDGPTVPATITESGEALVTIGANVLALVPATAADAFLTVDGVINGTVAISASAGQFSTSVHLTGLAAGPHVFGHAYACETGGGGSARFSNRSVIVQPL